MSTLKNKHMKKNVVFLWFAFLVNVSICQNIVITDEGNYYGNNSAMLDIKSTNKGLLIPRVTLNSLSDNSTITSPATGLLVYDNGINISKGFYYWNGSSWNKFLSGGSISDGDGDTKITLESAPGANEDFISFYTGLKGLNKEVIRINRNRLEFKNTGNSVFIGDSTGCNDILNDHRNTFVGNVAGKNGSWNINCVFVGYKSGYIAEGSYSNTFIGTYTGSNNLNGSGNTFIGDESGYFNTYGKENVFVGNFSGYHNSTGNWNVFIGKETGINNTSGNQNVFAGSYCGFSNTCGNYNTFFGDRSGYKNLNGYENSFFGTWAGTSNTSGYYNTFLGVNSGYSNTTGIKNLYLGNFSGQNNISGNNNVFIGESAGKNNITGCNNVFIGNMSGANETGGNKLYIENSNSSSPLIYGDFSKDSISVNGKLNVNGSVSFAITIQTGCSYTVASNDYTILCNPSTVMNINLPPGLNAKGRIYIIKKLSSTGSNNITINPNGTETIDGAASNILSTQYESIMIQSNGTNWFIIAKF
jgi:hypothetical protein